MQFFPPFSDNIFLPKEILQYKETYEEGTSYIYYTRHLGSTLTWYEATPRGQTAFPSILLCPLEERRGITPQK